MSRCPILFRSALSLVSALFVPVATVSAQAGFTGSVTYQVNMGSQESSSGPQSMTFTMAGTHRRMDMTMPADAGGGMAAMMGRSISTISDDATHTTTTLLNDKKMYITHTYNPSAGPRKLPDNTQPKAPDKGEQFTKTGKTETIAGIPCEDYLYTSGGDAPKQTEICNAHGFGFLWGTQSDISRMQQMGPSLSPQYAAAMQEFKDGFFPLKVAEMNGGKEDVKMLATKVDRGTPPAAAFAVPPDFTPLQMGGMGGAPKSP